MYGNTKKKISNNFDLNVYTEGLDTNLEHV